MMDKELENLAMDQDLDFDKKLEATINRKIRRIALKSAILVVAVAVILFLGISPVMNFCYTNAAKLNKGQPSKLLTVLRAYYETVNPYVEVGPVEVEKNGFGTYTLNMNMVDRKEAAEVGVTNLTMKMKRGTLSVQNDSGKFAQVTLGRFLVKGEDEPMTQGEKREIIEEIKKLPESANLYLSISDKKIQDVGNLMKRTNEDLSLEWVQAYQPECEFQGGVRLHSTFTGGTFGEDRSQMTGTELKNAYIENLKALQANEEAWKGLELYSSNTVWAESAKEEVLQETIAAAEKSSEFKTQNYCISGTKEEILKFLESETYNKIQVDGVQVSRLM